MPASIAWFDIPERHVATATRFHAAALRSGLAPELAVRLTQSVFRAPASTAPAIPAAPAVVPRSEAA